MPHDFDSEVGLLTSPEAGGLLQAALTGDPSMPCPGFGFSLDALHYRPGSEVTATYTVVYETPAGRQVDHLLATTADVDGPVARLDRPDMALRVWRHPADPRLPGLAAACDGATMLAWAAVADPALAAPGHLQLDLLAYRPLRRGVVRATLDGVPLFCKVLRPGYDDPVAERQRVLAEAGLTSPVLSRPAPGVILSRAVPGRSLAQHIAASTDAADLPGPEAVLDLLDRLPEAALDLPRRKAWSEHVAFHARTARRQLPADAERVDRLAARIEALLARGRHGAVVPTHGDLYEANVFVDRATRRLIDVDSLGPGLIEDDLACSLAHLSVLPALAPESYGLVPELLRRWRHGFERRVDASDLRARTAAVLLSLVAGTAAGGDEHRLRLAELWAEQAMEPSPTDDPPF